jgi:hypothetical protein
MALVTCGSGWLENLTMRKSRQSAHCPQDKSGPHRFRRRERAEDRFRSNRRLTSIHEWNS